MHGPHLQFKTIIGSGQDEQAAILALVADRGLGCGGEFRRCNGFNEERTERSDESIINLSIDCDYTAESRNRIGGQRCREGFREAGSRCDPCGRQVLNDDDCRLLKAAYSAPGSIEIENVVI